MKDACKLDFPAGKVTNTEVMVLNWLCHRMKCIDTVRVERRSDAEFDLGIEGRINDDGITYRFSGWVPLACLRVWYEDPKFNHMVSDQGTGDWSFVRDAGNAQIWAMFYDISKHKGALSYT